MQPLRALGSVSAFSASRETTKLSSELLYHSTKGIHAVRLTLSVKSGIFTLRVRSVVWSPLVPKK